LTLTWPGWANDWVLYGATNLAPTTIWLPVTNIPGSNNNQFNVSLPMNGQAGYYRLSAP
jgi:hypothetical protein